MVLSCYNGSNVPPLKDILWCSFLRVPVQVLDTLDHRHGLMLVGASASGKTAAVKCLVLALELHEAARAPDALPAKAVEAKANVGTTSAAEVDSDNGATFRMARDGSSADSSSSSTSSNGSGQSTTSSGTAARSAACICHRIFPKSLEVEELYGSLDATTREWQSGALEQAVREASEEKDRTIRRWIVLDGPVDVVRCVLNSMTVCPPASWRGLGSLRASHMQLRTSQALSL